MLQQSVLDGFVLCCLSETFVDSTISPDDETIKRYSIIRAYNPNEMKKGGVCILIYKEYLPLTRRTDICILRANVCKNQAENHEL